MPLNSGLWDGYSILFWFYYFLNEKNGSSNHSSGQTLWWFPNPVTVKEKVIMMPCKEPTQSTPLSFLSGPCVLLSSFFHFIPVSLPFLKHSGMLPTRVLNLWFPLLGMLFLQISEWFTSSLLWNSAQLLLLKWVFCSFFLLTRVQLHTLTQSTACSLLSSFIFLQDLSSSSISYILFYSIPECKVHEYRT